MFLHNQEWDLSTAKVPFPQYAKAVFKEVFKEFSKEVFKGVFKGQTFCTIIGTQIPDHTCLIWGRLGTGQRQPRRISK